MRAGTKWATAAVLLTLISAAVFISLSHKASDTNSSALAGGPNRPRFDHFLAPHQAAFKPSKLTRQLVRKHAANNTIIVAFANAHALDYTFNWLTYIFANNITNYLIGAIDRTTEMTLADAGVNCFSMYEGFSVEVAELPEGDLPFLSSGFLTIGRHKLDLIKTILGYKVSLVVSDVDTVWLQSPLPYFAQFPEADILASTDIMMPSHDDGGLEDPQVMGWEDLNIGIMLLRYNKGVIKFVNAWQQRLQQKGGQAWDQQEFNDLLRINMFKNHFSWWDHTDRWERVYKPRAPLFNGSRIVWGFNHTVTVGALPVATFANGHVFFNQKLHERLGSPLYVVHANFGPGGGTKRHKLRETQLWQFDTPAYYNVSRLLSFDIHPLETPGDWSELPTRQRVRFHIRNVAVQLQQFWDAAGAAVALNRTLILPTFTCYCDELWYWALEVSPSYRCRWPGARNQTLPFACPHDQLINYLQLDDHPKRFGAAVRYRESTFLENPRTPAGIKDGVAHIRLQLPEQGDERSTQQVQQQQNVHGQQRSWLQAADPIVTQVPVAWSITEDELRDTLSQYKDHRLLHFTEMGHVVLNTYRAWDRRRSHASLDRWRIMLYASVD
ncbi:hypothetical protein ABBQ38_012780 [Trebouxia sp. C0009 RCD-2024]